MKSIGRESLIAHSCKIAQEKRAPYKSKGDLYKIERSAYSEVCCSVSSVIVHKMAVNISVSQIDVKLPYVKSGWESGIEIISKDSKSFLKCRNLDVVGRL